MILGNLWYPFHISSFFKNSINYIELPFSGAYSYAGNGQRESLSDDDCPTVPPKNFDVPNPTGKQDIELTKGRGVIRWSGQIPGFGSV